MIAGHFFFCWIVAVGGIYRYTFFDTGTAFASVERLTRDQCYAAGVMRSLRRYVSRAAGRAREPRPPGGCFTDA